MKEIRIERSITKRGQDSLARYLQEIAKYPLLSIDEEIALAKKIRNGDQSAVHRLVSANLRFVVTVAKKYEGDELPLADLISDGNMGLIRAAECFDEKRGFKFISYAVWWIRQSILQGINAHKRMVHLPMNQVIGMRELWRSEIKLEQALQRLPTTAELAGFMQLPEDAVANGQQISGTMLSLDYQAVDQDGEPMPGMVQYAKGPAPDAALERESFIKDIGRIMEVLTPRERNILCLAYGIESSRPLHNMDISHALGLSEETIRRTKNKALERLRSLKDIKFMLQYL